MVRALGGTRPQPQASHPAAAPDTPTPVCVPSEPSGPGWRKGGDYHRDWTQSPLLRPQSRNSNNTKDFLSICLVPSFLTSSLVTTPCSAAVLFPSSRGAA